MMISKKIPLVLVVLLTGCIAIGIVSHKVPILSQPANCHVTQEVIDEGLEDDRETPPVIKKDETSMDGLQPLLPDNGVFSDPTIAGYTDEQIALRRIKDFLISDTFELTEHIIILVIAFFCFIALILEMIKRSKNKRDR